MTKQIITTIIAAAFLPAAAQAQFSAPSDWNSQWQASLVSGYFTGGTLIDEVTPIGDNRKIDESSGWLLGLRAGVDQEFWGWEAMIAGVFADVDEKELPTAAINTSGDASWLLTGLNLMVYPTGNEFANGRVRPFLTIGPALAAHFSDDGYTDGDAMFDVNLGGGVKILLGDQGNPVLRFDWRWHYMTASSIDTQNRQEFTVGIGINF